MINRFLMLFHRQATAEVSIPYGFLIMTLSQFHRSSDVADRRRWSRYGVLQTTSLTVKAQDRTFMCQIEDISLGGAKLRFSDDMPQHGDAILAHQASGEFLGRLVWRSAENMGVRFGFSEHALNLLLHCIRSKSSVAAAGG